MNASFMESILFNPPRSLYRRGFTNRKTSVLNELNNLSSLTLLVGFLPQLRPGSTPSSCCSLLLTCLHVSRILNAYNCIFCFFETGFSCVPLVVLGLAL